MNLRKTFGNRHVLLHTLLHVLSRKYLHLQSGSLNFFLIEDWAQVNVFRHTVGIRSIYPDSCGCHIVFIDEKGDG